MTEELKPCPFCGADSDVCENSDLHPDEGRWSVQCVNCDAGTARNRTATEAIGSWNTRASLPSNPEHDTYGAPPVGDWRPIATAPKDGSGILLGFNDEEIGGFVGQGRWHEEDNDGPDNMGHDAGFMDDQYQFFRCARSMGNPDYQHKGMQPTHWMPLPLAPGAGAPPVGALTDEEISRLWNDSVQRNELTADIVADFARTVEAQAAAHAPACKTCETLAAEVNKWRRVNEAEDEGYASLLRMYEAREAEAHALSEEIIKLRRAAYPTPAPSEAVKGVSTAEPVAYVPRCHTDGERYIVGEFAWNEISEKPFDVNPDWECAPLYLAAPSHPPATTAITSESATEVKEPAVAAQAEPVYGPALNDYRRRNPAHPKPAATADEAVSEDLCELLREARDNAIASTAEEDISADRRAYRRELAERLNAARRALQPAGGAK